MYFQKIVSGGVQFSGRHIMKNPFLWHEFHSKLFLKLLSEFYLSIIDLQCCVSGVQQSDSVIHLYMYLFFFRLFSIIGYYKILNIVPCAIQ